ncbi:MAG: OmpA family protein [Bacteroidota bacterium]
MSLRLISLASSLLALLSLGLPAQVLAQPNDCTDHPLITPYPGSKLIWCDEQAYQEYHVAIGPQTGYRQIDDWIDVAGQVHRLYYERPGNQTMTEIYRNYLSAVEKAGFDVLAEGLHPQANVAKTVGGRTWLGTAYAANPLPSSEGLKLFRGTSTSGGTAYLAARLSRPQGMVYLTVMVYQHSQSEVVTQLDIIEVGDMEDGLVSADADYMAESLETYGKVALYGLYFKYDQAVLTPESAPALKEVATLLQAQSALNLYVVGHSDWDGDLGYNLELSQRRASAIVEALVQEHGIARTRLIPKGVGPLVPVQSNQADEGKARNRRVELVERP